MNDDERVLDEDEIKVMIGDSIPVPGEAMHPTAGRVTPRLSSLSGFATIEDARGWAAENPVAPGVERRIYTAPKAVATLLGLSRETPGEGGA